LDIKIGGREIPGTMDNNNLPRFHTISRFHQLTQSLLELKRVPEERKKKTPLNLKNAYLGNDSDNVLTGDFTGDFRSDFGESQKSKVKVKRTEGRKTTQK